LEIKFKHLNRDRLTILVKRLISFLATKFKYKNLEFNLDKFEVVCSKSNIMSIDIADGFNLNCKKMFRL
jgi:hypothetical protein